MFLISDEQEGVENQTVGYLFFMSNAERFLFPLIQSWPGISQTAETLLLRREGEEVLFLNELRHRQKTALSFRIPLIRKEILSVKAALGKTGFSEGKNYRGKKVLAFILPIPGTR